MVRVGTAGWQYKDWEGIVYPPKPRPRGFNELSYMAEFFDAIEINSSFYGPPRPQSTKKWVESVSANAAFRFTAKLFHAFTHERQPAPNDEKDFKAGIEPLAEAGRLGALLLQFPWSFKNSAESRDYLVGLHRRFQVYPLVLEVRHASWMAEDILDLLSELGIGSCNIDQPLFGRSVRPAAHVTSTIGYVRLHGRNYRNWFSKTADVRERYDHLYSVDELEPWVDRVKEIAGDAEDTYVMSNNHNIGKAPANALDFRFLLSGDKVRVPPFLAQAYPHLQAIAR